MVEFKELLTEGDVSCIVYKILANNFHAVRAEVKHKTTGDRRNMRFDLVVFDKDKQPLFVVECKRELKENRRNSLHKKVLEYRKALDIPVYQIGGKHGIRKIYKIIENKHWEKVNTDNVNQDFYLK